QHRAGVGPLPCFPETVGGFRGPGDDKVTPRFINVRSGERQHRRPRPGVDLHDPVLAGVDHVSLLLDLPDARIEPVLAFGGELAAGDRLDHPVPALSLAGRLVGPQHDGEHTGHSDPGTRDEPFTHRVLQGVRPLHCATTAPRQGGPGWLLNGLCRCASTSWSATMSETPSRRAGQPHQSGTPPRNPGRRSTGSKPSAWTWAAPWSPPPVSVPRRSQDGRHPRSPLVSPTTRSSRPLAALWRP